MDASKWVCGWDVNPKQKILDEALTKWRDEVDRSARAIREADGERHSIRIKLRAGAQLQACANEFSDIDSLGLATRIADLEEEERVIVGGSDVLRKLKEDRDVAEDKLMVAQTTRDEVLQRIGGVEARGERNDSRIESLKTLLAKSKEELFGFEEGQKLDEEELEKAEQRLQDLFEEIESEFGAPPAEPDEIEQAARNAGHALEGKINKLAWKSCEIRMLRQCNGSLPMLETRHSEMNSVWTLKKGIIIRPMNPLMA
jgi:chromosome segregation ATPase